MTAERSRFGPYELVSRLGAGGMAETFVALRRGPGAFEQRVCLKRILPAFEEDDEFVRLFLEEARIAATLRHANIVQVLDFGVADGSHFMALELIDGLDLRAFLRTLWSRGESMTSGLVSYLAYEISNALEYAHRADAAGKVHGVVHRDISPSNVLVSTAGEVKLADFGIAKAMGKTQVTRSGNTKGKVPYMAPEYALAAEYDARSDLFSLGVTLYECMAGVRPFDGATELDTMRRIQDGEHKPVGDLLPTAPRALAEAIERLIRVDRDARYPNAAALQDALVDVAPPPTARRILGELVRGAQKKTTEDARRKSGEVAYADTAMATPEGTMMLDREVAEDGRVVPAATDVETRTSFEKDDALTSMDLHAAEAHRLADEKTRLMDAVGSEAVDTARRPEPTTPSGGRGGLIAVGALLLVTIGLVVGVVLFGRDDAAPLPTANEAGARPPAAPTPIGAQPQAPRPDPEEPRLDPLPSGLSAPPAVAAAAVEDEPPAPTAVAPDEAPAVSASGPTGLKIGVLPWGEVFVDGRSRGNAPVEVELRPGVHAVRVVGPTGLEDERRVRVTSGRMREVQIRLR